MSLVSRAMRTSQPRASALLVAALLVAGCGGTAVSPSATATATPAVASAAPVSAGASGASSGSGSGDCGEATAALVMKQLNRSDIVSVTTDGGCHDATIITTLASGDAKTGLAICDAASVIAYAGDLSSVTVIAATSKELSIGIKGQPCIGEP